MLEPLSKSEMIEQVRVAYEYFAYENKNTKHFANGDNSEQINREIELFIRAINSGLPLPLAI